MWRGLKRLLLGVLGLGAAAAAAFIALVIATPQPAPQPTPRRPMDARPDPGAPSSPSRAPSRPVTQAHVARIAGGIAPSAATPPQATAAPVGCDAPAAFSPAAALNAASLGRAAWAPFGRVEAGWEIYAPLVGRTIGTDCPPASPGFAAALARRRGKPERPEAGVLDAPTLQAIGGELLSRRPFVRAAAHGGCPAPPPPEQVQAARAEEGYGGKRVSLRADALAAFRRMRAGARAELAQAAADARMLTLISGYRDPVEEAARCAARRCDGLTRARCSAHRTGLAMDLYLGADGGGEPTSSDDANRLRQSRSPAYRWLVRNAGRFGFVPYPFEPWHWEWSPPSR